jgi:hypothetical protein
MYALGRNLRNTSSQQHPLPQGDCVTRCGEPRWRVAAPDPPWRTITGAATGPIKLSLDPKQPIAAQLSEASMMGQRAASGCDVLRNMPAFAFAHSSADRAMQMDMLEGVTTARGRAIVGTTNERSPGGSK